jgi:hypothetical protein
MTRTPVPSPSPLPTRLPGSAGSWSPQVQQPGRRSAPSAGRLGASKRWPGRARYETCRVSQDMRARESEQRLPAAGPDAALSPAQPTDPIVGQTSVTCSISFHSAVLHTPLPRVEPGQRRSVAQPTAQPTAQHSAHSADRTVQIVHAVQARAPTATHMGQVCLGGAKHGPTQVLAP